MRPLSRNFHVFARSGFHQKSQLAASPSQHRSAPMESTGSALLAPAPQWYQYTPAKMNTRGSPGRLHKAQLCCSRQVTAGTWHQACQRRCQQMSAKLINAHGPPELLSIINLYIRLTTEPSDTGDSFKWSTWNTNRAWKVARVWETTMNTANQNEFLRSGLGSKKHLFGTPYRFGWVHPPRQAWSSWSQPCCHWPKGFEAVRVSLHQLGLNCSRSALQSTTVPTVSPPRMLRDNTALHACRTRSLLHTRANKINIFAIATLCLSHFTRNPLISFF